MNPSREQLLSDGWHEIAPGEFTKVTKGIKVLSKSFNGPAFGQGDLKPARPATRLRQSSKPLMNKLETEFYGKLDKAYPIRIQAVTFKLANGLRYTPDFFCAEDYSCASGISASFPTAWEVKGAWVDGDSFPKLKMAASVFPEIRWLLVWKKDGVWQEQEIKP
jgi:hypothetical protein